MIISASRCTYHPSPLSIKWGSQQFRRGIKGNSISCGGFGAGSQVLQGAVVSHLRAVLPQAALLLTTCLCGAALWVGRVHPRQILGRRQPGTARMDAWKRRRLKKASPGLAVECARTPSAAPQRDSAAHTKWELDPKGKLSLPALWKGFCKPFACPSAPTHVPHAAESPCTGAAGSGRGVTDNHSITGAATSSRVDKARDCSSPSQQD